MYVYINHTRTDAHAKKPEQEKGTVEGASGGLLGRGFRAESRVLANHPTMLGLVPRCFPFWGGGETLYFTHELRCLAGADNPFFFFNINRFKGLPSFPVNFYRFFTHKTGRGRETLSPVALSARFTISIGKYAQNANFHSRYRKEQIT